ncbi:MAG: hypothetical protein FWC99_07390, partial [Coriobacteriia bacterium]|nr:hypothetical protein [Coriobacteriia bacterium]
EAALKNKVHNKSSRMLSLIALCAAVVALSLVFFPAKAQAATASISIEVQQIFNATEGVELNPTFDYQLVRLPNEHPAPSPLPAGAVGDVYSFSLTGNETRNIGPITFIHAGLFTYEVRSVSTAESGFALDPTVYTVTIEVTNVPGGGLVARISSIQSNVSNAKDLSIVFDKTYSSLATIPGDKFMPPVVKTVQGNPATPYTFTFRLEAANAGQPMPPGATGTTYDITVTGSGSAQFPNWSYATAGTFVYTIREIPSDNMDYVFDTTVYTITDVVRSVGGQLELYSRTVTNDAGNPVTSMSFINVYVGGEVEVQAPPPGVTRPPSVGPKTGDYADPAGMVAAMVISASIALFSLFLIYMNRKSEEEHGDLASGAAIS